MSLGNAMGDDSGIPQTGGPGQIVSFEWHGCAAHLETTSQRTVQQIGRFLALAARRDSRLPQNSDGSVVSVLSKDRGALVRPSAWQAWAAGPDQLV